MLTLSRHHVISDDDSGLMKLRGNAQHNTGRFRNVVAALASTMPGQG